MRRWVILLLGILGSCGYSFEGSHPAGGVLSISVPYIKGDGEGHFNAELVKALSCSGVFECVQTNGELTLDVAIIADSDDRIGYRFDRDPTSGELRDNIVGTENRRSLSAQVQLLDGYTGEVVAGPHVVQACADYDYVDSNSIRDLVFTTPSGVPEKVLVFSLGQLDSVEGAHDDTNIVIYKILAQRIVDGLIVQRAVDYAAAQEKKISTETDLENSD